MNHFDQSKLRDQMKHFETWKLALFTLLCTERLESAFWAFSKRESRENQLKVFQNCLKLSWSTVSSDISLSKIGDAFHEVEKIIHHSEDFGDPLAVQAQCASIALMYAIQTCSSSNVEAASWSASKAIETIENYILFSMEKYEVEAVTDFQNILLERELLKQAEDISSIHTMTRPSEFGLGRFRIRNSLFAIPICI